MILMQVIFSTFRNDPGFPGFFWCLSSARAAALRTNPAQEKMERSRNLHSCCIEAFKIAAQYAVSSSNNKMKSKKTVMNFHL